MTRPANVNFAKAVNFAMRNGFAKFAKWVVNFAMRNFAKVETNEQCIGIAKLNLALRNWHLALRNSHCEFWHCEIFALPNWFANSLRILAMRNFAEVL